MNRFDLLTPKTRYRLRSAIVVCLSFASAIFFSVFFAQTAPANTATDIATGATAGITGLNVFGDSLVDAGNIFNLTGFPPSPPYAQQLSNGPVWPEQLADKLGVNPVLSTEALPALNNGATSLPTEGINFALAGSLTSRLNSASADLPGLQQQVADFVALARLAAPDPNALYVLLAGGNDYNSAVANPAAVATSATLPNQVTDNLIDAASALIDAGARRLLVSNLPDLGGQPFADFLNLANPQSAARLSKLSSEHNLLLSQKLASLEAASGADIIQLDLAKLFVETITNPESFGFTNVNTACLTNAQAESGLQRICNNPDEFLFWDDRHPTAAGHRAIAQLAFSNIVQQDPKSSTTKMSVPLGAIGLISGVSIAAIALSKRYLF